LEFGIWNLDFGFWNFLRMKLEKSFYTRPDVVQIAKELIGKVLCTRFNGEMTSGIITETEAYEGVMDRASHAYGNRRTGRTEVMFATGGVAYIYLCYGMHSLFNIVTNNADIPHAVLIRGIHPLEGIEIMKTRSGKALLKQGSGSGPGNVSKLLGIHYTLTGIDLQGEQIWLEERGYIFEEFIKAGPRIGVQYAGTDALLPYRFLIDEDKITL
jgi:DNA-3-methyladenine glycosylase